MNRLTRGRTQKILGLLLMLGLAGYAGVVFANHRIDTIEKEQTRQLGGKAEEDRLEQLLISNNVALGKGEYGEEKSANFRVLHESELSGGWSVVAFLPNNDLNSDCVVMMVVTQAKGDTKSLATGPFPLGARQYYVGSEHLPQEVKNEMLSTKYDKYQKECRHDKS